MIDMTALFTVFTLGDWIGLGLLALVIVGVAIYAIIAGVTELYNRKVKKNCYECKHWDLCNVASCGDGCEYRCKVRDDVSTYKRFHRMVSLNLHKFYTKCDKFCSKYNKKADGSEQQDD